jgi:MFS family permease
MKKGFFYGYIIVFVLFIIQILMVGPRNSFGVFINPLTTEFGWSRALVTGSFSISTLIAGFSSIFMGLVSDRLGPRIVLTFCGILVGAGLMLMYFVVSAWQLYLFYAVLIGVGTGGLMAPQMSTVCRWFIKRRNIMTAMLMVGGGLGGLIAPPVITWIIYTYNWRDAFLIMGIGVFILMILAAQFLKRDPSKIGQVAYGEQSETPGRAPPGISGLSLKQALQTKKFWVFAALLFCYGFCISTPAVHIVPYAIDIGISPVNAAIILSLMNGMVPVGSIVVALIADRIGSRRAFMTCVCLLASIMLLLLPVTNRWLLSLFMMILSFGGGGLSVIQSTLLAELFGMKSHGVILGCIVFTFTIGGAAGPLIAASVYDSTGSYRWVFLLCGVLVVVAIILAIYMNRIRKSAQRFDQQQTL